MIPYDDLVVALSTWRARQGLPVVQAAGSAPAPAPVAPPVARTAPPKPAPAPVPQPAAAVSDFDEGESALVEEQHYDDAGEDYVVPFGSVDAPAEATAIGAPPAHGKRNDW